MQTFGRDNSTLMIESDNAMSLRVLTIECVTAEVKSSQVKSADVELLPEIGLKLCEDRGHPHRTKQRHKSVFILPRGTESVVQCYLGVGKDIKSLKYINFCE